MVAYIETDARDSHVVEIEFKEHVLTSTIIAFINDVNNRNVSILADGRGDDEVQAAFAFEGAPGLADNLQPRRDRFVAVRVPPDRSSDFVAKQLEASYSDIKAAGRRPVFIPATTPSDPYIGQNDQRPIGSPPSQWYLHRCAAPAAWKHSLGKGVIVANIDFGVRDTHEDLAGRFDPAGSRNVLDGSTNVSVGDLEHGTGAAGLIGAGANTKGIAGFAPECTLWLVQAGEMRSGSAQPPSGLVDPWATAIDWVVTKPASVRKVINLEFQTGVRYTAESSITIRAAVRRAVAADVFVCVPAGNGQVTVDLDEKGQIIPDTGSIVVAATGYDDRLNPRALTSNYGTRVRVAAPGEPDLDLTCGARSNSDYTERYGGTSGASAKVAGAVALMLSRNPNLTHKQVLVILAGLPPGVFSQHPIGNFLDCAALSDAAWELAEGPNPSKVDDLQSRWLRAGKSRKH